MQIWCNQGVLISAWLANLCNLSIHELHRCKSVVVLRFTVLAIASDYFQPVEVGPEVRQEHFRSLIEQMDEPDLADPEH